MTGATRAAKPPKTERGTFRLSKLAEKLPRSVYRLAAGVAPYPMSCAAPCGHFASLVRSTFGLRGSPPLRFGASALRCEAGRKPREGGGRFCEVGTTPRTANRETGVVCASRWLRLFPRQRDAARALREHFAQGERIVLAP